jgi:hypothetical protein
MQRDPAISPLFSTQTQESFYIAQQTAQIALRAHRRLDMTALHETAGSDIEGHITYLPSLSTLLDFGVLCIEE